MSLSTHVLDIAAGRPAAGIPVRAERWDDGWHLIASGVTDADGRVASLVPPAQWAAGRWRVTFELLDYLGGDGFFPAATVEFNVQTSDRLHLPLLLSPFGYTTYRGS